MRWGAVSAILAATAVIVAVVLSVDPMPPREPERVSRAASPTEAAVYAVIGEWEGKVAVYYVDSDTPKTVYDTVIRTLPDTEQAKLKNGIPVFSAKELALRLEDYAE